MKSLTSRLAQIAKLLPATEPAIPTTIFLNDVPDDEEVGTTRFWNGAALEIRYHANTIPTLPPTGSCKLIVGPALDV